MVLGLSWMDGFSTVIIGKRAQSAAQPAAADLTEQRWTLKQKLNLITSIGKKNKQCWSNFMIDKWSGGRYGAKTPQQLELSTAKEGVHKQHFKFWSRTCQTFAYQMFAALDKWSPVSLAEDVKWILLNHDGQSVCCQQGKSLRSGPSPHQPTN